MGQARRGGLDTQPAQPHGPAARRLLGNRPQASKLEMRAGEPVSCLVLVTHPANDVALGHTLARHLAFDRRRGDVPVQRPWPLPHRPCVSWRPRCHSRIRPVSSPPGRSPRRQRHGWGCQRGRKGRCPQCHWPTAASPPMCLDVATPLLKSSTLCALSQAHDDTRGHHRRPVPAVAAPPPLWGDGRDLVSSTGSSAQTNVLSDQPALQSAQASPASKTLESVRSLVRCG